MHALIVFYLVLQKLGSSTAELADLDISRMKEELVGFIMDQVLNLDVEHLLYLIKVLMFFTLYCQFYYGRSYVCFCSKKYIIVVGFVVWTCVMYVWVLCVHFWF